MCVICYAPGGTAVPGRKSVETCWKANADGAGFMWTGQDGAVHIRKGYMSFAALLDGLRSVSDDLTAAPVVLHFRIGTQGRRDGTNTHPFPVSSDDGILSAPAVRCTVGLAHNGVIGLTSDWRGKGQHSDTYLFVRDYASLLVRSATWHANAAHVELLGRMASSKLALLSSDGHCELLGSFELNKSDGCWYSNDSYRRRASSALSLFDCWDGDAKGRKGKTTTDARRHLVPRSAASSAVQHSVGLCFDIPGDVMLVEPSTNTLTAASNELLGCDRTGRVWRYLDDGDSGGCAVLLEDGELWDEHCDPWRPSRTATFCAVPVQQT